MAIAGTATAAVKVATAGAAGAAGVVATRIEHQRVKMNVTADRDARRSDRSD